MKTKDRVATALAAHEVEAIIEQARRRQRRRRQVIGLELVAVVVAWLVVMSIAGGGIWNPFAAQGGARSAGARADARPPLSGQARVTWRTTLGGTVYSYGGGGITFSGRNWSEDLATTVPSETLQPVNSLVSRIVDGQGYYTANVHGRWVWVHDPHPDDPGLDATDLPDPRTLLSRLTPAARFQAAGDQMRGGVRLTVLRATAPGRVNSFRWLPGLYPGTLPVVSLEVWADRQQVVHHLAITFRGTIKVDTGKPVSKAATRDLRRAESAWRNLFHRYQRTGKRGPPSVWNATRSRVQQAQQNAVQIRREIDVIEVTLAYSGIGQPQHVTAPRHTIPVSELG